MTPELRDAVLLRDKYRCVRCGDDIHWIRFSVHHRKLRAQGGKDEFANLITLCGSGTQGCHYVVHSRRKNIGWPGGFIVPGHAMPAEVPVLYHGKGMVLLGDPPNLLIPA